MTLFKKRKAKKKKKFKHHKLTCLSFVVGKRVKNKKGDLEFDSNYIIGKKGHPLSPQFMDPHD